MGEKTFNLTWNNHLANLSGLFEGLYKSGSLTDTTLACQGGILRAHRLVLAACSPYFERVFKEHYGEQPILILRGVPIEEMECLLDFMYRGSINVAEEHLPSLIKTATDLEIRGLSGDYQNETDNSRSRAESRGQQCQVEARLHQMDYRKTPAIPFLTKATCSSPTISDVKMEEIEVEDDPMIMEGHEDSFDESLSLEKEQIRHIPPPMFKRQTKFEGQKKRHPVNRVPKDNENINKLHSENHETFDNGSTPVGLKSTLIFSSTQDPTVPAIQMNEDSMDQGRSNLHSPLHFNVDRVPRLQDIKEELDAEKSVVNPGSTSKDTKQLSKSKAQYKPFPCDLCTLAFTRASHLARHRRVHTGERPFACSLCPRMFARQDKLKQHLDSHLQWPKRKSMVLGGTQQQTSSTLIGKGKRGRPRKVSIEQNAMEEILKFGEFSSMLNKSSYPNNKNRREIDYDPATRDEKFENFRIIDKDNQADDVENGINM